MKARILGTGRFLPERIITSKELSSKLGITEDWILEKSGIKERRFVEPDTTTAELAYQASLKALAHSKIEAKDIELIVYSTLSPDYIFPGSGCLLQKMLEIPGVPVLDISAQCAGFIYALSVAENYIKSGNCKTVLVACSEIHSRGLNFSPDGKDLSILFGDGAGCVILSSDNSKSEINSDGVISTSIKGDGRFIEDLWCETPFNFGFDDGKSDDDFQRTYPIMRGRNIIFQASRKMPEIIKETMEKSGSQIHDVDFIVPHQANLRLLEAVVERMEYDTGKILTNLEKYGNTSSASIPICFDDYIERGIIKRGNRVLFVGFGSGLLWGASLIHY